MEDMSLKVCKKCGETKALDDFYADPACRGGRRPDCKACVSQSSRARYLANRERDIARVRAWQQANPDRVAETQRRFRDSGKKRIANRKSHLKRTYGLTIAQYDELLALQGGGCAICGRHPRDGSSLHVDQCHDTGRLRGLLCFRCNNALGDLGHDASLLEVAVQYLRAC